MIVFTQIYMQIVHSYLKYHNFLIYFLAQFLKLTNDPKICMETLGTQNKITSYFLFVGHT